MNDSLNQTDFSVQQPLSQKPEAEVEEIKNSENQKIQDSKTDKNTKLKKAVIIFAVIFFVLIFAIVIFALSGRRSSPRVEPTPPAIVQPVELNLSELEQKVEELQNYLDESDPTKQDLVFPPVNFDLRLDPSSN